MTRAGSPKEAPTTMSRTIARVLVCVMLGMVGIPLIVTGCGSKTGKPREALPVQNVDKASIEQAGEANKGKPPVGDAAKKPVQK
jgi:hypothetical protein